VGLGISEVKTEFAALRRLKFGSFRVKQMEVGVLDLTHVNTSYRMLGLPEIDGVLGSDFFMKYNAVINFEKRRLILKREN
jgi:hypothetical protein